MLQQSTRDYSSLLFPIVNKNFAIDISNFPLRQLQFCIPSFSLTLPFFLVSKGGEKNEIRSQRQFSRNSWCRLSRRSIPGYRFKAGIAVSSYNYRLSGHVHSSLLSVSMRCASLSSDRTNARLSRPVEQFASLRLPILIRYHTVIKYDRDKLCLAYVLRCWENCNTRRYVRENVFRSRENEVLHGLASNRFTDFRCMQVFRKQQLTSRIPTVVDIWL